jgi:hypothetical protein
VVAPDALRVRVTQGESGYDLTTVTEAVLIVRLPDCTVVSWPATIEGTPTVTELAVTHTFAPSDTAQIGTHRYFVELTVPGGTTRTEPMAFEVVDAFAS